MQWWWERAILNDIILNQGEEALTKESDGGPRMVALRLWLQLGLLE